MNKIYIVLLALSVLMMASCNTKEEMKQADQPEHEEGMEQPNETEDDEIHSNDELVDEFLAGDPTIADIFTFLNEEVNTLSPEEATVLVTTLEEKQRESLSIVEEKYVEDNIQAKLFDALHPLIIEGEEIQLDHISDEEVLALIETTHEYGYKMESAEGMFHPVINYELYRQYEDYVTEDLHNYIQLMATETTDKAAEDAALAISWDELVQRTIQFEKFIHDHPNSIKVDDIEQLHDQYMYIVLYGLPNSPLFDDETNRANDEAVNAYKEQVSEDESLQTTTAIAQFLQILEENDRTLTDEVENFRSEYALE